MRIIQYCWCKGYCLWKSRWQRHNRHKTGIRHRRKKVFSAYWKFIKEIHIFKGRLSIVLDFFQYKYLSIKFLLLTQVAVATSWSKGWNFLEILGIPEVLGRGTILSKKLLNFKTRIHTRTTKLTFTLAV